MPRLFIFDCCDGDGDFGKFKKDVAKDAKSRNKDEQQLAEVLGDVADVVPPEQDRDKAGDVTGAAEAEPEPEPQEEPSVSSEALWAFNTEHPDYQLAELSASTWGFQSKLNTGSGSYLISGFVERAEKALADKGYVPRIGALFKGIQEELRSRNKQLPSYIWFTNCALLNRNEFVCVTGTTTPRISSCTSAMMPSRTRRSSCSMTAITWRW